MILSPIYYSLRKIDGHQAIFNFINSGRSVGKSTQMTAKIINAWKKGFSSIVIVRYKSDIDEEYTANFMANFSEYNFTSKIRAKSGVAYILDQDNNIVVTFYALNRGKRKSIVKLNVALMFFDEYIVNLKRGDHYLRDEVRLFMELYGTIARGFNGVTRCYFFGNPWSLGNPYFTYFKVDTAFIKPNTITTFQGGKVAVEFFVATGELKALIESSAYFQMSKHDEEYFRYILEGKSINDDVDLLMESAPADGKRKAIFSIDEQYIEVKAFFNNGVYSMYFGDLKERGNRQQIDVINFADLEGGSALLDIERRKSLANIKNCVRNRRYFIAKIEYNTLVEKIYLAL